MKKAKLILFLILSSGFYSYGQFNLVPNPSFEQYDTCPHSSSLLKHVLYWENPLYLSTPDYFNTCDTSTAHTSGVPDNFGGSQSAHTGNAYAGIITCELYATGSNLNHWREYVEAQLTDSLLSGIDYCIRFYVSAYDKNRYVSNNIGVYFSQNQVQDTCDSYPHCLLYNLPQFENSSSNLNNKDGWTEISGTYTAVGGERYIIIGNFRDSALTNITSTGWTGTVPYGAYYIDDVLITPCDSLIGIKENNPEYEIKIFPSPFHNEFTIQSANEPIERVMIFNDLGQVILDNTETKLQMKISVDASSFADGIYFIKVFTIRKNYNLKILKN